MYDQFRLDSCKIRIVPTQSVLLQGQKQSLFISAIDRNGLNEPDTCPSFSEIASYSSAFQRAVNLDASTWSCSRKVYASSIQEKSFYIPTAQLYDANGHLVENAGANIFNGQNITIPWNPQFLLGITCLATTPQTPIPDQPAPTPNRPGTQQQFANIQTWNYMCQFEWCVTFRGLRYDAPDANAPIVNVNQVVNPQGSIATGTYVVNPTNPPTQVPTALSPIPAATTANAQTTADYQIGLPVLQRLYPATINAAVIQTFMTTHAVYYPKVGDTYFSTGPPAPPNAFRVFLYCTQKIIQGGWDYVQLIGVIGNPQIPLDLSDVYAASIYEWFSIMPFTSGVQLTYTVNCSTEKGASYTYTFDAQALNVTNTYTPSYKTFDIFKVKRVDNAQRLFVSVLPTGGTAKDLTLVDITPFVTALPNPREVEGLIPVENIEDTENFDPDPTII